MSQSTFTTTTTSQPPAPPTVQTGTLPPPQQFPVAATSSISSAAGVSITPARHVDMAYADDSHGLFKPSALAIVNNSNNPLLLKTCLDSIDDDEAAKLLYLLHASLDIVEEKLAQEKTRDNFLGVLYQCEQYRIYGHTSTTKIKILLMISQKLLPRENDIRQMLKNIQKAYVEATAMNPFYKPSETIKSKRFESYLHSVFQPAHPEIGS